MYSICPVLMMMTLTSYVSMDIHVIHLSRCTRADWKSLLRLTDFVCFYAFVLYLSLNIETCVHQLE